MVRTASPRMLPEHGLDRKLTRYEGETWENFRVRLMMYADTCRLGGTEVGTLQAVRSLGFTDVEMVPAYELEGSREHWAEFYVILSHPPGGTAGKEGKRAGPLPFPVPDSGRRTGRMHPPP